MTGVIARLSGLALLVAVAQPALALEFSSGRFANLCRTRAPRATCDCVVGRLAASPDGRFALEAYELVGTEANAGQRRAVIDLLDRHGMKWSDAQAAISRLQGSLEPTIRACM
jgi:hypothetical protein